MKSPSRTETNPLLAAALRYAARGWPVFPLQPRDKIPYPKTTGLKEASTNRSTILGWWQVMPNSNIGIATGNPVDVLDIDSRDSIAAVRAVLGDLFRHRGPTVSTGKGWHLYFAAMEGSANRAKLFDGHVDFRGKGGYVVAPPSIHPSGRVYTWDEVRGSNTPLPEIPEALRTILLKPAALPIGIGGRLLDQPDGPPKFVASGKVRRIIGRPDIVTVAMSIGCKVYRMGGELKTNCVFHPDEHPSMVLFTDNNRFLCNSCEATGDSNDLRGLVDMHGRKGTRP